MSEFKYRTLERNKLSEEIQKLQGTICALQQRYNTLAPISVLSDDVLCDIFLMLSAEEEDTAHLTPWTTVISLSLVCIAWRQLTLSLPLLWRKIDCNRAPPEWISTLLERSRGVPLLVTADITPIVKRPSDNLRLALPDLGRISALRLYCSLRKNTACASLISCLLNPAPLLHTLTLVFSELSDFTPSTLLPDTLFTGDQLPQLRDLHLYNCIPTFSSSMYNSLTSLVVKYISPSIAQSASAWITILQKMPLLELLAIRDAITGTGLSIGDARLPYLHSLELRDNGIPESAHILAHLKLPSRCHLHLLCYKFRAMMSSDLRFLLQNTFPMLRQEPSQMVVEFDLGKLEVSQSELVHPPEQGKQHILVVLYWEEVIYSNAMEEVISALEPHVSEVEDLIIMLPRRHQLTSQLLVSLLLPFNGVRRLSSYDGKRLFEMFSLLVNLGSFSDENVFIETGNLLPQLHRIELRHIAFTTSYSESAVDYEDFWLNDDKVPYDALESLLLSRLAMKAPIKELEFWCCSGVAERQVALETLGVLVIWGRVEPTFQRSLSEGSDF